MNTAAESADPGQLEEQANRTREEVDHTLDALEQRFSIRRRVGEASQALGAAAARVSKNVSPGITAMIRVDHTHVLAAFRRYRRRMPSIRKQALVANVCLALEVHSLLEEEIFYPALLESGASAVELDKSVSDHDEMRALIAHLRQLQPRDAEYEQTFLLLMRTVLHHVADEETILLPLAETALRDQLGELGWKMTVRRLELLRPRAGEALTTTAMTFPVLTGLAAVAVLSAVWLLAKGIASTASAISD
jgi:hypothetical protein